MKKSTNLEESLLENDFFRKLDEEFSEAVHTLPNSLILYLKNKILNSYIFKLNDFVQLELVLDTNILYSEIRSLMINGSSFFLKLTPSPLLKLYAPSKLREELLEKIKVKFPKDNKTKNLDIDQCLKKANIYLEQVTFCDELEAFNYGNIISNLQNRDSKDIPFVALHFNLRTHGIITNDKDISDFKEIRTWKLKDVGKVITEIKKGCISLEVISLTLPNLLKVLYEVVAIISHSFILLMGRIISFLKALLKGTISKLVNISPEIFTLIGLIIIILALNKQNGEKFNEFLRDSWVRIKKFITQIKLFFIKFYKSIRELMNSIAPVFKSALQVYVYLFEKFSLVITQLQELENSRPLNVN